MKKTNLYIIISIVIAIFGYYFYFIDTLTLSEVTGRSSNPIDNIVINLVDFDTGLTRYDIHNLTKKAPYWDSRIQHVNSIKDPKKQQEEFIILMDEMLKDASMKKIIKKVAGFGSKTTLTILKAAMGIM